MSFFTALTDPYLSGYHFWAMKKRTLYIILCGLLFLSFILHIQSLFVGFSELMAINSSSWCHSASTRKVVLIPAQFYYPNMEIQVLPDYFGLSAIWPFSDRCLLLETHPHPRCGDPFYPTRKKYILTLKPCIQ